MTIPDDGETIGLFEPLMISEGAPARAGMNDLALELAKKSAAFRSGSRAPLRLAFPAKYAGRWMPGLFPDQDT